MDVVVLGGHGQIARLLLALLAARGDQARGIVRNPDHAAELSAIGAVPLLADVEREDITLAGGGRRRGRDGRGRRPGSGPARKRTVDLGRRGQADRRCAGPGRDALPDDQLDRRVGPSARRRPDASRTSRPRPTPTRSSRASGLDFTIVRPGRLTDDPGTGRVDAAERLGRGGSITRADTAAILLAVLDTPSTIGLTFEVLEGETPIAEAVGALS